MVKYICLVCGKKADEFKKLWEIKNKKKIWTFNFIHHGNWKDGSMCECSEQQEKEFYNNIEKYTIKGLFER